MAGQSTTDDRPLGSVFAQNTSDTLKAAGATPAYRFSSGLIMCSITGSATAITAQLQRSALDPASGDPAQAWVTPVTITGNPSTGIAPDASQIEPGVGWWRVNVTSLTGAAATINLSGLMG